MPSLSCYSPHQGVQPCVKYLQSQVIPQWIQAGIFSPPPGEGTTENFILGATTTHNLILVDITSTEPARVPPTGLSCFWYFSPSPILPPHTFNNLGTPHLGVAASGMIVGELLQSLPPVPPPELFSRIRGLRAVPLITALPSFTPFSERVSGLSREQLRQKLFKGLPKASAYVLITRDSAGVDNVREILEYVIRLKALIPGVRVVVEYEDAPPLFAPLVLAATGVELWKDLVLLPNPSYSPSFYHVFDAALGITSQCYFPTSLIAAATCGIPTLAPDIHTWSEAITHAQSIPIPVPFMSLTPADNNFVWDVDLHAAAELTAKVVKSPGRTTRKIAQSLPSGPLGSGADNSLLTMLGLL